MPKRRKTRKEKIQIDQKRDVSHEVITTASSSHQEVRPVKQSTPQASTPVPMTFSLPVSHSESKEASHTTRTPKATTVAIATAEYGYLGKDLSKTALLTSAIIIAELLIRLFYLH